MKILSEIVREARRTTRRLSRGRSASRIRAIGPDGSARILFVANAIIPTLQLSFLKPLKDKIDSGLIQVAYLTEAELNRTFGHYDRSDESRGWITEKIKAFNPSIVVFCRYSGPNVAHILDTAHAMKVPTLFHIDDDLLGVPLEIGEKKHAMHNEPMRLWTIRHLLNEADLVYCSTTALAKRLKQHGARARIRPGKIYCSGDVLVPAKQRPATKVGYMGFDHAHDLEMILPALVRYLDENPGINFELFGSIPKPAALERFGERIIQRPPIPDYAKFLDAFATLGWDIGICPLATTRFNAVKANTKWVEYTSVGTAVVASANTVYDECCSGGCGSLASDLDGWYSELNRLTKDDAARHRQVSAAQARLRREYSTENLRHQVMDMLMDAGT